MGTAGDLTNYLTAPDSTGPKLVAGSRGRKEAAISLGPVDIGEEASNSDSPRGNVC